MKIFGADFTSQPGPRKAITWVEARFEAGSLQLVASGNLRSLDEFESFLAQPGPWLAGMDFPLGQPRRLVENLGWPATWHGYVALIDQMSRSEFVETLDDYRRERPAGDKQHLRQTDRLAGACSPMMLYGVPVGKMFFEGAPRLLRSGASLLPCLPRPDPRLVIETYPALVARRWIGRQSYKNDARQKQTPQQQLARQSLLQGLFSNARQYFGFDLQPGSGFDWQNLHLDASGDQLDALLCAVQAGWAYTQSAENYGIPVDCDPLEGWIVDPGMIDL